MLFRQDLIFINNLFDQHLMISNIFYLLHNAITYLMYSMISNSSENSSPTARLILGSNYMVWAMECGLQSLEQAAVAM